MTAEAIAVVLAAALVGIAVWWAIRPPRPRADHVSQGWRDEHARDRRD